MSNKEEKFFQLFSNLTLKTGLISLSVFIGLFLICYLIKKLIINKLDLQRHTRFITSRLLYILAMIIGSFFFFHISGLHIAAVASVIGVFGLAIGLASKDIIENLISGVFLIGDLDIKIGDYIELGGNKGVIEYIGILYTNISHNGNLIKIPNKSLSRKSIIDFSHYPESVEYLSYIKEKDKNWDNVKTKIDDLIKDIKLDECNITPKATINNYEIGIISIVIKKSELSRYKEIKNQIIKDLNINYIFDFKDWTQLINNINFINK